MMAANASKVLRSTTSIDYRLNLISLALKEFKFSSDKVIKIVKTWLSCLKRCEANIDKTKDELKELIVKRPHLVMMVLDDVGGADVGYHGSNFPTPNIDRLATHEDIRLENTGTDDGTISEVKQFYTQNGKTIQHPHYKINSKKHRTISYEMCADWVANTKDGTNFLEKGGMGAVDTIFQKGGVLVLSL